MRNKITLLFAIVIFTSLNSYGWWTSLYNRGTPWKTYYLGDYQNDVFEFAVNQETTGWSVSYGIGKSSDGSGWTWRAAEWSRMDGVSNRVWKSKVNEHIFTSTGNWYYSGRFTSGSTEYASGDWFENRTSLNATSYFNVSSLENPSSTSSSTLNSVQVNLSWTRWNSKNVIIIRKTSSQSWTEPIQGTTYTVGSSIGSGVVVFKGSETSFSDVGLTPSTGYDYKFYSENNSYYSVGVTSATATTLSSPISSTTGDWNNTSTWSNNLVPGQSEVVTIANGHTVTLTSIITHSGSITVNNGGTLATNVTLTANGNVNIDGTFRLNAGGWATGSGTWNYGSTGTLSFQSGTSYGVNSDHKYWPASNGPINITVGGDVVNSALTLNTGSDRTITGIFAIGGTVTNSAANLTISNGTLQINSNGSLSNTPIYSGTTTLIYNNGGLYTINTEWPASNGPTNITVQNSGTSLDINDNRSVSGNLTIASGAIATVSAGKQLTVSGTLTNNAGNSGLVLESNATGTATLIHGTSNVGATVKQYLTNARNYYISSPVTGAVATEGYTYFQRDEAYNSGVGSWTSQPFVAGNTFTAGKGYIALPATAASTLSFSGTLNTGNQTIALTKGGTGFNLIGNPYPAHLAWTKAFVDSETAPEGGTAPATLIEPSIYIRTNAGTANNSGQWSFQTYNATEGIAVPTHSLLSGGIIPPMQAFWVKAKVAGNLILTSALTKSHQTNNPLKAPAMKNNDRQLIRLQLDNSIRTDETVIYTAAAASSSYDRYDSPKFDEANTVAQLYTIVESEKLVINGVNSLPLNTPISLGFVPGDATSFTLKANEVSNLPADVRLIIKDNLTSSETDLTDGATTYQFNATESSDTRFSILFKSTSGTTEVTNPSSNMLVFAKDNKIAVQGNADLKSASVNVFNGLGQLVHNQAIQKYNEVLNNYFASGVYLVNIYVNGAKSAHKVIVK